MASAKGIYTQTRSTAGSARERKQRRAAERRKSQLVSILAVAGIVLVIAGLLFLLSRSDPNPGLRPPIIGQPMGSLTLKDLNGENVHLSDYAGKPVLINAWATWCPPCRAEMPDLEKFYEAHQAEGFTLLAVNAGEDSATVSRFIAQEGFSFPVLLDPNTAALNHMGISSFPTSILIGADGKVKLIHAGMFTPESIQSELVPALAQK